MKMINKKCYICGARNVDKHTPQQRVFHSLKVLVQDIDVYFHPKEPFTGAEGANLEMAMKQARKALEEYRNIK
jgi:hypothetical protein